MLIAAALATALAALPATEPKEPSDEGASPPCATFEVGPIGSATAELARLAQLTGAAPVSPQLHLRWSSQPEVVICQDGRAQHPGALEVAAPPAELKVGVLPIGLRNRYNSASADDRNDGALWAGRGLSTAIEGGFRLRWRFLSATVAPVIAWQQNRDFYFPLATTTGQSPYANPFNYGTIDLPVRFGPSAFWTFDPGQSTFRADLWGVAAGISSENLWWGPGQRNSLLMTNSAPGMAHLFLGTSRPVDIWIGWLEAQMVWAKPRDSRWFDTSGTTSPRFFNSLNLGFEPSAIRGLFLGLTRVYVYAVPPGGLTTYQYLGLPLIAPYLKKSLQTPDNPEGQSPDNQLTSIYARWVFPGSGLELYGEWGRDDHSWDFKDFVTQPSHSSAGMAGLQKVFPTSSGWVRLVIEAVRTLEVPTNNPPRGVPIFYTHYAETEGYTNRGQMLGAGIGPQGDSQWLAVDYFAGPGWLGGWLERVQRNGRWYYDQVHVIRGQDVELALGVRGGWTWPELELNGSLGAAQRYNMNFGPDAFGVKAQLDLTWWPGRAVVVGLEPIDRGRP
jgi:hypothetical protein